MGSPCVDLLYFIYCGTDANFRKLHLSQLMNHYYDTFSNFLTKLDIDPEETFSKLEFEEDFRNKRPFGLITAILQLPAILSVLKPDTISFGIESSNNEIFEKRFIPIVKEFIELNIL